MQALRALSKPRFLWQDAADAVRRAIITGELAAGERVSEAGLAERLGVSRQPARDAVRLLVQEGLLAHRDGVTTVVGCTEEDVRRLYRFRVYLEAYAARAAARGAVPDEIASALRLAVKTMEAAWASGDTVAYVDADLTFHRTLVAASGDRWAQTAWEGLAPTLRATMTVGNKLLRRTGSTGPSAASAGRHRRVMEHVLTGDAELAEAVLRASLTGTVSRVVTRLTPSARESPSRAAPPAGARAPQP